MWESKKRYTVKSIAVILAVTLLLTAIPAGSAAETEAEAAELQLLYEIEELREKNTKVFYREDGMNVAIQSAQALHYKDENGDWQDIDNTLQTDAEGDLTNTAAGYRVELPQTLSANSPVVIESEGHTLEFTLLNMEKKAKAKEDKKAKQAEKKAQKELQKKAKTEEKHAKVDYAEAIADTDITYEVQPESVKESIVLQKKPKKDAAYTYFIKADGLTGIMKEDGSIEFTAAGEAAPEFVLPAPYMYDSSEAARYSSAIEVDLKAVDGGYELTYTPDQTWLRDKETTYPVTIDPTIETNQEDNFEAKSLLAYPGQTPSIVDGLIAGYQYNQTYAYYNYGFVKLTDLGMIPVSSYIVSATLNLAYEFQTYNGSPSLCDFSIVPYEDAQGNPLIWSGIDYTSNQNLKRYEPYDICKAGAGANQMVFNITKLIAKTYTQDEICFGLVKTVEDMYNQARVTCDLSESYVEIVYAPIQGIDKTFSMQEYDLSDAGTAYFNEVTGNILLERTDITGEGTLPLTVKRLYYPETNGVCQWHTNFDLSLRASYPFPETTVYYFTNEYGKKIQLNAADYQEGGHFIYADESGLYRYDNGVLTAGNREYTFNNSGRLERITDSTSGDYLEITRYVDCLGIQTSYIGEISDNHGRSVEFVYNDDPEHYGYPFQLVGLRYRKGDTLLQKVDYTVELGYYEGIFTFNTLSVQYYGTDGQLARTASYTYHDYHCLSSITASDGYRLSMEYTDGLYPKVSSIQESGMSRAGTRVQGDKLTFSYAYRKTVLGNLAGDQLIKHFDAYGNLISTVDQNGNSVVTGYETEDGEGHSLLGQSEVTPNTNNLLSDNRGFEGTVSEWEGFNYTVISESTGKHETVRNGNKAVQLNGASSAQMYTEISKPAGFQNFSASAWVKTSGSAKVQLELGGPGSSSAAVTEWTSTSGEWLRMTVRLDAATLSTGSTLRFTIRANGSTVYVDDCQIAPGNASFQTNLILNGDFAENSNWLKPLLSPPAPITQSDINTQSSNQKDNLDNRALQIAGSLNQPMRIAQTLNLGGKKGETYSISAWAKAENALPASSTTINGETQERKFAIRVQDSSVTSAKILAEKSFNWDDDGWQKTGTVFQLEEDCPAVYVYLVYDYQYGTVLFDGVELMKVSDAPAVSQEENADVSTSDEGEVTTILRDENGNPIGKSVETQPNVQTGSKTIYDNYGNVTQSIETDGQLSIESSSTYSDDGAYLLSYIDPSGVLSTFTYDQILGLMTSVQQTGRAAVSVEYDALGQLISAAQDDAEITYTYQNGRLASVTHNNTTFSFYYTAFGNLEKIKLDYLTLLEYQYVSNTNRRVSKIIFANGDELEYTYDAKGRLTEIRRNNTLATRFVYDDLGELLEKTDYLSQRIYKPYAGQTAEYDLSGNLLRTFGMLGDTFSETVGGTTYTMQNQPKGAKGVVCSNGTYQFSTLRVNDAFQRSSSYNVYAGEGEDAEPVIETSYSYEVRAGGKTNGRVKTVSRMYGGKEVMETLEYNAAGELASVSRNGERVQQYTYDELGQLIREDNKDIGRSTFYTYDDNGNILESWYYVCKFGAVSEFDGLQKQTLLYNYDNTTYTGNVRMWKDTLKVLTGPITYDDSGNPLRYRNSRYVFTWEGRQLATAVYGGKTMAFTYDENGLRTSKTVGDVTTRYTWSGEDLTSQSDGNHELYFYYDGGNPVAVDADGELYYYVYNTLGDVMALVDEEGQLAAQYAYDAYGQVLKVMDGAGNDVSGQAAHIANLNPIRYRGYYYDTDLKFYYLKSRYYDPEVGRFISPDELTMAMSAANGITSPNLYTYANNNPIRYTDSGGKESVGWVYTPIDVQWDAYYRGLEEHYTNLYRAGQLTEDSINYQLYVTPMLAQEAEQFLKNGYINVQQDEVLVEMGGRIFRYMEELPLMMGNVAQNGCGMIAAYNVLHAFSEKVTFGSVYNAFNNPLAMFFRVGLLGVDPLYLTSYMQSHFLITWTAGPVTNLWGIKAEMSEAVIVLLKWPDTLAMHYIAGISTGYGGTGGSFRFYGTSFKKENYVDGTAISIWNLLDILEKEGAMPIYMIGVSGKKGWW